MKSISKITYGVPEEITPIKFKEESKIKLSDNISVLSGEIEFTVSKRGCKLELPLELGEEVFGFGLQLKGFNHKGTKKHIRSNADPILNSGDSHAPVPFYVTTKGYGIYIDTARYVSFYCGYGKNKNRKPAPNNTIITTTQELYEKNGLKETTTMIIDIPVAKGVDVYIFEGRNISEVVEAYNMFSGGGSMPSIWGLGILYRCYAKYTGDEVLNMAKYFRQKHIPCDIIGLEPGWQSSSYSCSYVWDKDRYPNYEEVIKALRDDNFNINLWEHAFVNSVSPLYKELNEYSGDVEVWQGLVPDFADGRAQDIFASYHKEYLVDKDITGFKLDECDGSDFTGGWSFPDCSEFPSGIDGEQMHSLFGNLYQKTILKALGNTRTLSEVRNAGAFASPYPFVLYSDLYNHKDFIRGCANAGFSGLLWTPEVRNARNKNDLVRRLQTVVFSVQALVNAWYIEKAPWIELDAEKEVKEIFELRMSLLPYLYSAFYKYYKEGTAPVRALVSDYTDDENTYNIDNEYMFGESMLVAPMTEDEVGRKVYLPDGLWFDFWTNEKMESGWHNIKTENIPVFVKNNSIIPIAKPNEYINKNTIFEITLKCYGEYGEFTLIEDDGESCDADYKEIKVDFNSEAISLSRYILKEKVFIL